jgi:hypothetical protein
MSHVCSLGWTTKLLAAVMLLAGTATADAAWWSGSYYPATRSSYYRYQPYYAYYGANYAPVPAVAAPAVAAPSACQTCRPAACATTVQRVCSYVPQTTYQVAYRDVPVTSYHPVTTIDHCSGSAWTSYRPVTTCSRQAYYVPQTTYRPVCTNVAISTAPTVAYYAAPAVAMAAAPATGSCCEGSSAVAAPAAVVPSAPANVAPGGSSIPQPAIEPSAEVPNASGQSILNETQTRTSPTPAQVQPTQGWKFGGPAPAESVPRDRTAMATPGTATMYRPVNLSKSAIEPAGGSAAGVAPAADAWRAAD